MAKNHHWYSLNRVRPKIIFAIIPFLILVGGAMVLYVLGVFGEEDTPKPIFTSPLAEVDFLIQQTDYPQDWPDRLRYPDEFKPIDFQSGLLPEDKAIANGAKFLYAGNPVDAADLAASFFEAQQWKIGDKSELESGGLVLIVEIPGEGSGIAVFDPDPEYSSMTRVVITFFSP